MSLNRATPAVVLEAKGEREASHEARYAVNDRIGGRGVNDNQEPPSDFAAIQSDALNRRPAISIVRDKTSHRFSPLLVINVEYEVEVAPCLRAVAVRGAIAVEQS